MNNCKICQNNKETFNLPVCNHAICKDCSNQQIFGKVVNHNNLDFLQCPICTTYVQIDKIKKYIDEKDYKLITDLIEDRRITFGLGVDDALVKCFNCQESFLVNKGLQIVKCFKCKQEICKNCNKGVHKNITCAQNIQLFLQSKENSIQKPLYEEQQKNQKQEYKQDKQQQQEKYHQEQKQQNQKQQQYEQVPINYQQNTYQQQQIYYPVQQQQNNYQVYQQNQSINVQDNRMGQQQYNQVIVNDQKQIIKQPEAENQGKQLNKQNTLIEKTQSLEEIQGNVEEKEPGTPTFTKKDKQIKEQNKVQQDIIKINNPTGPLEICIICFDPVANIKLPICAHSFCRSCLNEYLLLMVIKPKCLDQLMCPSCQTKLQIESVQDHLDKQIFNQISDLILESGQIYGLLKDEVLVKCQKCEGCFIVNKGQKVAKCVNCSNEICMKCNKNYHKGMTCEEAFGEESSRFQKLKQAQGWIKCPKCNSTIERVQGCNFMRCESSLCKKRTFFCFLCKQLLTKEDHYKHYKNFRPYGDECEGQVRSGQSQASTQAENSQKIQQEKQQFEKEQQEQTTQQFQTNQIQNQNQELRSQNQQQVEIQNQNENQQAQEYDLCIICFDPVGDINLPICRHPFCRPCLNEYLLNMVIKPKLLDQLMCPYCRTKLEIESVQQHLDKQIFNQISDLILESGQIYGMGIDDALFKCIKCDACYLINKGLQVAKCGNCATEICRKCNRNSHQDMSCEESAKSNMDEESLQFQQFAQTQGWIKCPKCNQTIERIKGCNFIRCESSECKRRTYFCFLCRQLLTQDDHYKHFFKNNPYNNDCKETLKKQQEFLKTTVTAEKPQDSAQIKLQQQQIEKPQQQQTQPANQIKYENNFRFTIETPNIQNQNIQYQYVQQVQPQNQQIQKHQPDPIKIGAQQQIQNQQIQQVYHYDNNMRYTTVTQSVQNQNIQYQPVYMQFEQPQQIQKQQPENQQIKIGNQIQNDVNQRQTFVNSTQNIQYQIMQQQIQQANNKYQVVYQQVDVRQHQQQIQQQNVGQLQLTDQQQQNQDNPNTQQTLIQMQQNNIQQTPQNQDEKNQGQDRQEQQNVKPKISIKKIPVVRNIPQTLKSDPSFGPPETEYNLFLLQILTQNCRNCANELEILEQNIRQCQECENKYCNKCFCQIFSDHIC